MSESLHFHYAKRRFVKTHALSLLGTKNLRYAVLRFQDFQRRKECINRWDTIHRTRRTEQQAAAGARIVDKYSETKKSIRNKSNNGAAVQLYVKYYLLKLDGLLSGQRGATIVFEQQKALNCI
ncbi:MAG: hypothetical protein PHF31_05905 [Methylobacter sp.]|nr:hypothetical protein [Methylobacter sp.]